MSRKAHPQTQPITPTHKPVQADTQRDFAYDSDEGAKALAALRPRLDAIPPEEVATNRIDVSVAAYAALAVARFVQSPDVRPRFAALPKDAFDMAVADDLGQTCFAALFSITEAQAEGALDTEAKLPPAIAAEATELEKRMQTVCEYQLSDDPQIAPLLAILRPGTGYRDLLNDLKGYVWIYEKRPEAVKADSKNYRPGDLKRAKEMIGIIGLAFSDAMSPKAWQAYDTYLRVWTVLEESYDEVRPPVCGCSARIRAAICASRRCTPPRARTWAAPANRQSPHPSRTPPARSPPLATKSNPPRPPSPPASDTIGPARTWLSARGNDASLPSATRPDVFFPATSERDRPGTPCLRESVALQRRQGYRGPMASLAALLSTRFFPADEASRLVEDTKDPRRTLVFSAVRAESDARFLEAITAFFETIDWSGVANAEYGHHPVLAILGAARNESATDHLARHRHRQALQGRGHPRCRLRSSTWCAPSNSTIWPPGSGSPDAWRARLV